MNPGWFPAPRKWAAPWIWLDRRAPERNTFALFRRTFDLGERTDGHTIHIAAETYYQLFVNGRLVGRGAPLSQPWFHYYDEHPLDGLLAPGRNCIAALVYFVGNARDTRGGLLVELTGSDGEPAVVTDEGWRAIRATAWRADTLFVGSNQAAPFQEHFDARLMPEGWTRPDFDDAEWGRAAVLGTTQDRGRVPWTLLVPRDTPFPREEALLPEAVASVEECLEIANRPRSHDLSIALSVVGRPLALARVEEPENLRRPDGSTALQCSTNHLDRVFDGVYDPCIVLDFGEVITGRVELDLEAPEGAIVDIGYAERLIDGHFSNALECQFADRYVCRAGRQRWQPFAWKAFRFVKLRLWQCSEPLVLRAVRAVTTTYPFEEKGRFSSSDERLNAVFEMCRRTIRLCSNEWIMDTPWREQAQWVGDVSAVTLGGIYACFGDTALPGKFLRQSAASQMPTGLLANVTNVPSFAWRHTIPDYSLWWVIALWRHFLYTGEERWLHHLYPHVLRIIQAFLPRLDERGLLADVPYWVFIDWADVDKGGECAALNALFYEALRVVVEMARVKGDAHTVVSLSAMRERLAEAFVPAFYDPGRGCLADANIEGSFSPKTSEHANAAAIAFGLCDDTLATRMIKALYEDQSVEFTEAQPFFTSVVLQALDRAGRFDLALRTIEDRWGKRMLDRGATSTFEEWGMNGSWRSGRYQGFLRSLSHAWSAHPAEFLIRNLIGLEILQPGCRKVRIAPRSVSFDYQVTYPTPLGPITVASRAGKLAIETPEGIELVEAD